MQLTNQINNTNNLPTLINPYANDGYVFFFSKMLTTFIATWTTTENVPYFKKFCQMHVFL